IPTAKKRPFTDSSGKNITDTSIKKTDTSIKKNDTLTIKSIDTLNISKDSLHAPVSYSGKDSGVLIMSTKEFILYGKANVKYKDMNLDAATIRYNQSTQMIKAYGDLDSTNNPQNKPAMKQAETTSIMDTIAFNMKSMKGLTKNTYLHEDELYINARILKKVSKDVYYGRDALI